MIATLTLTSENQGSEGGQWKGCEIKPKRTRLSGLND
ncbi:hypothetical protein SLEP1_g50578 [Rubroshorea leprosula]|uniref:Uncharacterized protein n=1 Tax=Rubroshorea leprosula TaxID=152421 RepID=A0AAV5M0G8_9ROSI|nr:hypothetical protein SLEP1_g50578 [Rubroshorea leprosula]